MQSVQHRIDSLIRLKEQIRHRPEAWNEVYMVARNANPWFTLDNIQKAVDAILDEMIDEGNLLAWYGNYDFVDQKPARIGLIMAGNLPLVGFADWLAVYISGHQALVKCSDKDNILFPALMQALREIDPGTADLTIITDRLKLFDAVIATGSDNAFLYFEQYFGHVPHIFRKNRTSIAVINGNETEEEIDLIGEDIKAYFGLGCRNISYLLLPVGYDLKKLLSRWELNNENILFDKYKNNFDYNLSVYLLNKVPILTDNNLILVQDENLFSRISCVNYGFYHKTESVLDFLNENNEKIQCIVSSSPIEGIQTIMPGHTQKPGLFDYADGVDTMDFLSKTKF